MIRPATDGDDAALAKILGDWVAETPWMPKLHSDAEDLWFLGHLRETTDLWLVEGPQGRPSGFLARENEDILALYLASDARGMGLGKALLDHAKIGRSTLRLWTFQANLGAQRFYAREGFLQMERTVGTGNQEGLPDVRLIWKRTL